MFCLMVEQNKDIHHIRLHCYFGDAFQGIRLDKALRCSPDIPESLSRTRIRQLIEEGYLLSSEGEVMSNPARKVRGGEDVYLTVPIINNEEVKPEEIELDIVFEDDYLLVINKPVGMVVHPGAGQNHGTLVNALLHACDSLALCEQGNARPGIVHRLDKDTSGLLVVAKTNTVHRNLTDQFAERTVQRRYFSLVWGDITGVKIPVSLRGSHECSLSSTVDGWYEYHAPIWRDPRNRKKMAVMHKGRHAITLFRARECYKHNGKVLATLVECRLRTGRTHQIRVHMHSLGIPVIGDSVYGTTQSIKHNSHEIYKLFMQVNRQMLHAKTLSFTHPINNSRLSFSCDLAEDMLYIVDEARRISDSIQICDLYESQCIDF